ncbi:uncharacterized protein LOC101862331 [Aplysia californica]|uniref:Uncharacterized protein LOC101862331 n=1 Tax=Aplysia californica TaxID=6500 RepID=A0ABM1VP02_APLCA|nr:uncharacterized protein LOC101862331 [Aplysia californica]XP_005092560.2 uncharacterized protein LOC101862331 [Aplysia californica]XP_035824141.1 uncharacterized protein LOC101862331 [Aplysia californica]XP_035824142.1 uncharacterized protein LOC101862331 [Aplysia californica]XP_035824143.1 uncharacterized protein LOC101862331 [Aplysia californica]XP_035824144.1 uncharacterized protein LOC101862331 [Aplysia californica]XP_035824145.1 uncharacterized protein LOC101862331 [Aplysia californic
MFMMTGSGDKDSISSFSSDDSSYREKFEKEKEKNLKLTEKLRGYESVVGQYTRYFSDHQAVIHELEKRKNKDLAEANRNTPALCTFEQGASSQVLTDPLDSNSYSISNKLGENSSSLVVTEGDRLKIFSGLFNKNPCTVLHQGQGECSPHKDNMLHCQLGSKCQDSLSVISSPASAPSMTLVGQGNHSVGCQFPSGTSGLAPNTSKELLHQNQANILNSKSNLSGASVLALLAEPARSDISNTPGRSDISNSSVSSLSQTHNGQSQVRHTGASPSSITAVAAPNASTMSLTEQNPHTNALPNGEIVSAEQTTPQQQVVVEKPEHSGTSVLPPPVWGIGARPKDTNPLDWLPLNMAGGQELGTKFDSPKTLAENNETTETGVPPLIPEVPTSLNNFITNAGDHSALLNALTAGGDSLALNIPGSLAVQNTFNGENDLMTFQSLKLTPSPEKSFPGSKDDSHSLFVKQPNQVVAVPSDDQEPQLASQAHSMMAKLRNSVTPPAGLSDMLYKFAEEAGQMEKRFTEYQALIQRQQVQIQSYAQQNSKEELQRLRRENESLAALAQTKLEATSSGGPTESVKVTREKQQAAQSSYGFTTEMTKKVETLTRTNEQLYKANKDWHNKWESLLQKTREEKQTLESQISSLSTTVEKYRQDLAALEQHLEETNAAKRRAIQKSFDLDQEKLNQSRELEMVRGQLDDLTRLKRKNETELSSLKSQGNREAKAGTSGSADKAADVELLKQQLAVFHEDFQKEREDRSKAESKVEKMRKERDSARMEQAAKMKKMQVMLNAKDAELKNKSKQVADMQHQINALKKELHKERQKNDHRMTKQPASVRRPQHMLYPSGGPRTAGMQSSSKDESIRQYPYLAVANQQPLMPVSPEHLPNAWQCRECTFINFPERTICDICGWQNDMGELMNGGLDSVTGTPELKSRGEFAFEPLTDEPDVVTDTESTD